MTKENLYRVVEAKLHQYKDINMNIVNFELEIESLEIEYEGCKAIQYEDYSFHSNSFNSITENELLQKEADIKKLKLAIKILKNDKKKITNALTCFSEMERRFFELYFNNNEKNTITDITKMLHFSERKTTYELKSRLIYKVMDMLYPRIKEKELPLFNKNLENTHFIHN